MNTLIFIYLLYYIEVNNDDVCSIDMMIVLFKYIFNISIGFYGSLCGTNTATNDANRSLRYLLIAGLGM
jgi:hypothetical protein